MGRFLLVVVDSFSKWIEVEVVGSTNAESTTAVLRKMFATHGIPRVLVSDNGPGFASDEFNVFLKRNGVKHLYSAPYHPSSNGQAERTVRTFKESLKSMKEGNIDTKLCRFLFTYRITPQTTTGFSPAELLFGRRLRSALTLLRPDRRARMEDEKSRLEDSKKLRSFQLGDDVLAKNYGRGEGWLFGKITEILGATNYKVKLADGRTLHRHVDQLLQHYQTEASANPSSYTELDVELEKHGNESMIHVPVMQDDIPLVENTSSRIDTPSKEAVSTEGSSRVIVVPAAEAVMTAKPMNDSTSAVLRRTTRPSRKPAYLEQYQ